MAGADGAIESVRWKDGAFAWRTIGDLPPEGICGSGLVDLLAEASRTGLLLPDTSFASGAPAIDVAPEHGIDLSRSDVSNLAQAKAANAVGQLILMRRLGVTPEQVDSLFLAGAFANALDVPNAIAIGLLAPVPRGRVRQVGNASVRGAKALLLSARRRRVLESFIARLRRPCRSTVDGSVSWRAASRPTTCVLDDEVLTGRSVSRGARGVKCRSGAA
jgi:uncharacterized 2Fe-2S/4Fe-4S cluster protein (DUF4445 family)